MLNTWRLAEGESWIKYNKPVLFGKIYYAPKNKGTDAIMEEVQLFFDKIKDISDDITTFLDNYDQVIATAEQFVSVAEPFSGFLVKNANRYNMLSNEPNSNWRVIAISTKVLLEKLKSIAACFVTSRVEGSDFHLNN